MNNIGENFELDVLCTLKLIPGVSAEHHKKVAGKDVDIFLRVENPIYGCLKIIVECKCFEKKLNRSQVASIISDYIPIIERGKVDKFYLITKNGIVANASEIFDNKKTFHFKYEQLFNHLFGFEYLIENMIQQFKIDYLDKYFVERNTYDYDVKKMSSFYSDIYKNEIVEYISHTFSRNRQNINLTDRELELNKFANIKTGNVFSGKRKKLLDLIRKWESDDSISQGIAILGSYGTGKSSFSRFLAYHYAKQFKEGKTTRIPFLINLGEFGTNQDIRSLVTNELVNKHFAKNCSYETFQSLNRRGRFLIILDGFDEMKFGMTTDTLLYNFNELNKLNTGNAKVIILGRPTIFESEKEQLGILSGKEKLDILHKGEYLQIKILPLEEGDILNVIENYIKLDTNKKHRELYNDDLIRKIKNSSELKNILSRPVHIPMFISVLPDCYQEIDNLTSFRLYSLFVEKTIKRELHKNINNNNYMFKYEDIFNFSRDIAVFMYNNDEFRSIRYSEIPDYIIDKYMISGYSAQSIKRELVKLCFLERKNPDILFFPHKSFCEFLVASSMIDKIIVNKNNTDLKIHNISEEVLQFFLGGLNEEQTINLYKNCNIDEIIQYFFETKKEPFINERGTISGMINVLERSYNEYELAETLRKLFNHGDCFVNNHLKLQKIIKEIRERFRKNHSE